MKLLINFWMPFMALFFFTRCDAQIQHAATETIKVYGNCGMCEKTIEKAAFKKGEAKADWDQESKMAVITYDSSKTTLDDVLKRIAAAGYDSDKFRASDEGYINLHSCCQYERPEKAATTQIADPASPAAVNVEPSANAREGMIKKVATPVDGTANPLTDVYTAYFALKDALVLTDAAAAAAAAKVLFDAMGTVKTDALTTEQHNTWMKYQSKLRSDAGRIKGLSNVDIQRQSFATLSKNMYEVMKVIKPETAVYLDHCPMYNDNKGADWLSKEKGIKNPYYGKSMLTCGSVKETLN